MNVTLRAPELSDIDFLMETENNDEAYANGTVATGPYSRYQLERYVKESTNDIYTDLQLRLMIMVDGEAAGIIDLFDFNPRHRRAEVGVFVAKRFRQRAVASKALNILENHCFRNLGIHQLYAYIREDNEACLRLFRKAGFKQTGKLTDWVSTHDGYKDVYIMQHVGATLAVARTNRKL